MSIFAPLMNPIRFYPESSEPDYTDYFPIVDRMQARTKYIEGIYPANYYKEWLINETIYLQFRVSNLTNEQIVVTTPTRTYTLNPTDITPTGWTGTDVRLYSFTPDEEGVHYMTFTEPNYISDSFYVCSTLKWRKRLVEVSYRNSENDYSMIFWNGTQLKYTAKTFFGGMVLPSQPENEISGFETDRGVFEKLQSTPKRVSELIIADIYFGYIDNINMIFACDTLTVNGVSFQTNEPPQVERIPRSDLVNITLKLIQTDNDFYIKE